VERMLKTVKLAWLHITLSQHHAMLLAFPCAGVQGRGGVPFSKSEVSSSHALCLMAHT
jgi:hypothetical protein